MVFLLENLLLY